MSCPDLQTLDEFAAGDLGGEAREQVAAHVSVCADCQQRVAELQRQIELARRVNQAGVGAAEATQSNSAAMAQMPPPDSFPGYRIVKEVSRGGQGVVYQAVQQSTRRKVAIKVLREGQFADAGERARFEREVQILGQLKHPNIVNIYDSGRVGGNAFYVMDYVSGKPLDEYVQGLAAGDGSAASRSDGGRSGRRSHTRNSRLGVDVILRLFERVCDAVHEAHLKGIIHRDLKPSNIRVDAHGEPHVLDFGLAKVAGAAELSQSPAMTMTGQFLGSLPWSSPEQAEGQSSKIDVRTDVYSLGVILYQLLTGKFPYEVIGTMRDVLERIMHSEPAAPRASSSIIDDETETILLKCLAKERERRYQSAGELARDLARYLAGEPIEAKRDSALYVLKKTLRRYRMQAGFAATLVVLTLGFSLAMYVAYSRAAAARSSEEQQRTLAESRAAEAQRERDRAIAAESVAKQETERAIEEGDRAAKEGARAAAVKEFLQEMLTAADPTVDGRDARVVDVLNRAAQALERHFDGQPDLEAEVRNIVGMVYLRLGVNEPAEQHLTRALQLNQGRDGGGEALLQSLNNLGEVQRTKGDLREAEKAFRGVVQSAVDPESRVALVASANLASTLMDQSRLVEAEGLYDETLKRQERVLGEQHPDTLQSMSGLSKVLMRQSKYEQAERVLERLFELLPLVFPESDPRRLDALGTRASLEWSRGDPRAALATRRKCLELARRVLPPEHPTCSLHQYMMAHTLEALGQYEEAEREARQAIEQMERSGGGSRPEALGARSYLADIVLERGDAAGAERILREALNARSSELGETHSVTLIALDVLAEAYQHSGRLAEARELAERVLDAREKTLGPDHGQTLRSRYRLGVILLAVGEYANAEKHLRTSVDGVRRTQAADHWLASARDIDLAECLGRMGRAEEGQRIVEAAVQRLSQVLGAEHRKTKLAAETLERLRVAPK